MWGQAVYRCGEFIEETINKTVYLNIICNNINQIMEELGIRNDYYFQSGHDPRHTAANLKMACSSLST